MDDYKTLSEMEFQKEDRLVRATLDTPHSNFESNAENFEFDSTDDEIQIDNSKRKKNQLSNEKPPPKRPAKKNGEDKNESQRSHISTQVQELNLSEMGGQIEVQERQENQVPNTANTNKIVMTKLEIGKI